MPSLLNELSKFMAGHKIKAYPGNENHSPRRAAKRRLTS